MRACPPPMTLDRLLAEDLDSSELSEVTAHVEACSSCQVALDQRGRAEMEPVVRLLRHGEGQDHSGSADAKFIALLAELPPIHSLAIDGERPTVAKDDELPRIDGYEILGELGRGGMGVVYKALHVELNRPVALKMILAGPQLSLHSRERFRNEACAIARLHHPNIVQVYDFGEQDGRPYFSMELVSGGTLAGQIGGAPFTARRAARLIETLAQAVEYAHRNQVLHRDLKPANILVDADPSANDAADKLGDSRDGIAPTCVAKITDFGLAKEIAGASDHLTQTGMVLGTPSYIAPEQARGQLEHVGAPADVYSLGAILYELLGGRPPFRAASPLDTLVQVVHELPISVMRLQPRIPRDLATICMKCLEKEPRSRYPTAALLAEDLRRFLDHEPIRARPIGVVGRVRRWGRREPALAAMIVALFVVIASAFAFVIVQRNEAIGARDRAEEIARSESMAQARGKGAQRAAERANVSLIVDRAMTHCEEGDIAAGLLWLALAMSRAETAQANDYIPAIQANLAAWSSRLLVPDTSPAQGASTMSVAFSPDGRQLLSGAWDSKWGNAGPGEARLWTAQGWKAVGPAVLHPGPVVGVGFSPDGQRALTGSQDGTVRLWSTSNGTAVISPISLPYRLSALACSRDGKWFVTAGESAGGKGVLDRWDTTQGCRTGLLAGHPNSFESVAISPDGKHILTGSSLNNRDGAVVGGEAQLWNAATGEPQGRALLHSDSVKSVAFSPDGKTVLTGCDDTMARLWDTSTGKRIGTPQPHAFPVHATVFSPDGETVVSGGGRTKPLGSDEGEVRVWDRSTGRLLIGPLLLDTNIHAVAWKPDGKSILTGSRDGRIRIWDVGHLHPLRRWDRPLPVMALAYSPDGKLLFTGGGDFDHRLPGNSDTRTQPVSSRGRGWIDDADTGRPIASLEHSGPVRGVAFSADGGTIATGTHDGQVRLWDASGRSVCAPRQQGGSINCLVFRPDGRSLVTCGYSGGAQIWLVPSGRPLGAIAEDQQVRMVRISPDGRTIATASRNGDVRLWDATTRQPIGRPMVHRQEVMVVAFSPNGRDLLTGCDGAIWRWDTRTCLIAGSPLPHSGVVWTIRFSDDGERFLSVAGSPYADWGYLRVWHASTMRPFGPPLAQRVSVNAVAFRPGSMLVATGGWEGDVRLWDVARGQPVGPALPLGGSVLTLAFDPLGKRLAAAGENGHCRIWAIPDPVSGTSKQVQEWVESLTGLELDSDGATRTRNEPVPRSSP